MSLLAERHKLRTRLATALLDRSEVLDEPVAEQCREIRQRHLIASARRLSVIKELHGALAGTGVDPLFIKGLASEHLHGSVLARDIGDIDIVVDETEVETAIDALVGAGFDPDFELQDLGLTCWQDVCKLGKDFRLYRREVVVEIHWRFTQVRSLLPNCFVEQLDGRKPMKIDDNLTISVLSPMANLVYLSVHGAWHQWARIHWLADIPYSIEELCRQDLERVLTWARSQGYLKTVLLGVALSQRLLNARIPGGIARKIDHSTNLKPMIDYCLNCIVAERVIWSDQGIRPGGIKRRWRQYNQMIFGLKLRKHWPYRAEYVAHRLFRSFD